MGKFDLYGNYTMDPLLRSRRELVVQIFSMVDHPENLELSVAALSIVQHMSSAIQFDPLPGSPHKIFSILEEAGSLASIQTAFMNRLEREEDERLRQLSPESAQALLDSDIGAAYEFGLANILRLQILDFFIENCSKPGYNLAHFLLGFDAQKGVKESILNEAQDNCLFLILDILNYGLGGPGNPMVCLEHPSLAAKAFQLVWTLLSGRATAKPMMKLFANPASRFNSFISRHFSQLSLGLTDASDVYMTAHELRAKAALIRSLALELNISLQLSKEQRSLDQERVAEYLKSIDSVIRQQPGMLSADDQYEYAASIADYVQSICRLLQVALFGKLTLAKSIEPVVLYFVKESGLSYDARESLASLLLLIVSLGKDGNIEELLPSILQVICLAEGSVVLRGYLYSCIAALPRDHLAGHSGAIKTCASRLVEVIVGDINITGTELDAWKTLAVSALTHLIGAVPSLGSALAQAGYLKSLIKSIKSDEINLAGFFSSASAQHSNALYLWKAIMSLFKGMLASSVSASELLADAGLLEQLASLSLIDRQMGEPLLLSTNHLMSPAEDLPGQLQKHFQETIESVLSILVLMAQQNGELGNATIHRGLLQFIGSHFELLSRQLVLKTGPKANSTLLSYAADLVVYAGPELVPVAARHGISLKHVVTNMLVKALLALESTTDSSLIQVSLGLCNHALQFIAASRLHGTPETLIDFDELPLDQLTVQGKLPISIIERLVISINRIASQVTHQSVHLSPY